MKRLLPVWIVLGIMLVALVVYVFNRDEKRSFDRRVSLRQEDKIPYGTFAARNLLPGLFPGVRVYNERNAPGYWDSLSEQENRQAVIYIGTNIDADDDEVESLLSFAGKGNHVFLIGADISYELSNALRVSARRIYLDSDSLEVKLTGPRFDAKAYHYSGTDMSGVLTRLATDSAVVLGTRDGRPNFMQFRVGEGYVFVHSSPLAFSNYFVLQPRNQEYLASAFSVIPRDLKRIAWNEYYIGKKSRGGNDDEPNWLAELMKVAAFRWALWLALLLLLLYALSEMRRKQRWIPAYERPKNDSLDFVKTVGRLYYDKRDHENLAAKMIQYFLESVRQQYKIPTGTLDADFVKRLQARSGYPAQPLEELIGLIVEIRTAGRIAPEQLGKLHQQLEKYYQHG